MNERPDRPEGEGIQIPLEMPDLDILSQIPTVSCWLAPLGSRVVEGDRLIELLAGEVVIDLAAPATGRLAEKQVAAGDSVTPGHVLAVIETGGEPSRE